MTSLFVSEYMVFNPIIDTSLTCHDNDQHVMTMAIDVIMNKYVDITGKPRKK